MIKIFVYLTKNDDTIKITHTNFNYIYRIDPTGKFNKWIGFNDDDLALTIKYYTNIGYKIISIDMTIE